MGKNGFSPLNIRQANGVGRVHVSKPQMKLTYCGRTVNEEEWVVTSKEANCSACTRSGAPRLEWPGNSIHRIAAKRPSRNLHLLLVSSLAASGLYEPSF